MRYDNNRCRAISDLKNYNRLKGSLDIISTRIELLKKLSQENSNGISDEIARLQLKLETNTALVLCIENALSTLSPEESRLLSAYYINRQRGAVEKLSINSYSDRSTIYRRARKALDHYIFAFFGEL